MHPPLDGRATPDGTAAFAHRAGAEGVPPAHFRISAPLGGLTVSSIGFGTYLGAPDTATDLAMASAVGECARAGINVFDCALNYRDEHSERAVGQGLAGAAASGVPRAAAFVSTKGGFLVDTVPPGVVSPDDVAAECHAFSPTYIGWALDRSRANLGIATVDLYYVHNPETQLERLDREAWLKHLGETFRHLEQRADAGHIGAYGIATWSGLRVPPDHPHHVPLERVVEAARDAGGPQHRLRAVQLPLNLGMPEAVVADTQELDGRHRTAIEAAGRRGLAVFTSASTAQGRLVRRLPPGFVESVGGADGSATRAVLQFTRSCPGVTTALVGMTQKQHRDEDVALARSPPLDPAVALRFVTG